jgi:putative chitinase
MNRSAFFASVRARASGNFGTSLTQSQVDGREAVLNKAERRGTPLKPPPVHQTHIKLT